MAKIEIGNTGLRIEQNGFGALPIQRISKKEAVYILRKAHDGGIDFFDTARAYTDSEEKLGEAFQGMRDKVIIATKAMTNSPEDLKKQLETSLKQLKTDYIDIFQLHMPSSCPIPGDESGLYDAMFEAKAQGKIRFIGITNHRLDVAKEAVESGLYDTLQFPFSYLSNEEEQGLAQACKDEGIGFIAMKALSGGLITNSAAACAWICQHKHVIPIWGIQKESELDEFLSYIPTVPKLTDELMTRIDVDRRELSGDFCRGCGYCMPCPQGIVINMCARASLLMRRAPSEILTSDRGQAMMKKVEDCIECGQCSEKCPYDLDTPALLKRNYIEYKEVLAKTTMK